MQQTEKYQLNLIETTDPISPEPINENTRALETQLLAQEALLQTREAAEGVLRAEFQGADAALRSELQAADAALEQRLAGADAALEQRLAAADAAMELRLAGADAAAKAELEQKLAAETQARLATDAAVVQARNENALLHLLGPVGGAGGTDPLTVSLAGVDVSQYQALMVFCLTTNPAATMTVGSTQSYLQGPGCAMAWIWNVGGTLYVITNASYHYQDIVGAGSLGGIGGGQWDSSLPLTFRYVTWVNVYGLKP